MKTKIYTQHTEHSEWTNKLLFFRDELDIMQKRLEEVNSRNTGAAIRAEIEHFQNQMQIQRRNIEEIREKIRLDEAHLMDEIRKNKVAADHKSKEDHTEEREMMEAFERSFESLRKEFKTFLANRL
jgi:hypothetical protein